ncbi:MAG: hypothetical protein NC222_06080 [Staphylococcus sp.]|nr:hypothetical protein [Staphylococcus sp.]
MAIAKNVILKNQQNEYLIPYVPNATNEKTGLVKPDGTSITVDSNGVLSAISSETKIDNITIVKNSDGTIKTVGVEAKTGQILYDWVGTTAEYETAVSKSIIKDNWVCLITDAEEVSNVNVDNVTITKDSNDIITSIGTKTKTGEIIYDWIGTTSEYQESISKGEIEQNWVCLITDAPENATKADITTAISEHNIDGTAHQEMQDDIATNIADIASLEQNKANKATTLAGYGITDGATKEELEQLNFIKFVDTLPLIGEEKYIYAVPQSEVDKDNRPIIILYLWQNNEWNSVGAFSININPDSLATKEELNNYLPLTGGTMSGPIVVPNGSSQGLQIQMGLYTGKIYATGTTSNRAINIDTGNGCLSVFGQNSNQLIRNSQNGKWFLDEGRINVANGIAPLDANKKVPLANLPEMSNANPDEETIITNTDNKLTAVGIRTKNDTVLYNWIGTLAEWETGRADGTILDSYKCYIIDDQNSSFAGTEYATKNELTTGLAGKANNVNTWTLDTFVQIRHIITDLDWAKQIACWADGSVAGQSFTAPADGFICGNIDGIASGNILVNGYIAACGGNNNANEGPFSFFVKKGDVVTNTVQTRATYFTPYKNQSGNNILALGLNYYGKYDTVEALNTASATLLSTNTAVGRWALVGNDTIGYTRYYTKPVNDTFTSFEWVAGGADTYLGQEADYVVDSYSDDSGNWYRLYKSGWIEQGGIWLVTNGTGEVKLTLLKPMKDMFYQILLTTGDNTGGDGHYAANANLANVQFYNKTPTGFFMTVATGSNSFGRCWNVKGYVAQ